MPVDHKRINGPETSEPYYLYSEANKKFYNEEFTRLQDTGQRADGRSSIDLRKIYMKTGVVTQAKGSAYIEQQNTKVIVSVFDPREIPNRTEYVLHGELYCEFKFAPFSCQKRRGYQPDAEEKEYSVILRRALESVVCRHEFPNFQVDIYALVLENDGSALSAAITCAGLALAQAGVPMYDTISAVSLGRQGKHIFLDPTYTEEQFCSVAVPKKCEPHRSGQYDEHGTVILSILSTHEQISEMYQTGCISFESLTETIQILIDATKQIVPLMEKCIAKYVLSHVNDKEEDTPSKDKKML